MYDKHFLFPLGKASTSYKCPIKLRWRLKAFAIRLKKSRTSRNAKSQLNCSKGHYFSLSNQQYILHYNQPKLFLSMKLNPSLRDHPPSTQSTTTVPSHLLINIDHDAQHNKVFEAIQVQTSSMPSFPKPSLSRPFLPPNAPSIVTPIFFRQQLLGGLWVMFISSLISHSFTLTWWTDFSLIMSFPMSLNNLNEVSKWLTNYMINQ